MNLNCPALLSVWHNTLPSYSTQKYWFRNSSALLLILQAVAFRIFISFQYVFVIVGWMRDSRHHFLSAALLFCDVIENCIKCQETTYKIKNEFSVLHRILNQSEAATSKGSIHVYMYNCLLPIYSILSVFSGLSCITIF